MGRAVLTAEVLAAAVVAVLYAARQLKLSRDHAAVNLGASRKLRCRASATARTSAVSAGQARLVHRSARMSSAPPIRTPGHPNRSARRIRHRAAGRLSRRIATGVTTDPAASDARSDQFNLFERKTDMINHGQLAAELLNDAKQVHGNPSHANTLALVGIGNALLQIAEQLRASRPPQDDGRLSRRNLA